MKTIIITSILILLSSGVRSQCNAAKNAVYISGFSSELIYAETHTINFGLEEYFNDDDRGIRQLVTIDQSLEILKERLKQLGLKDVNLVLMSVSSINPQHYGQPGTKETLKNVYSLTGIKLKNDELLNIVNNLRFKGLNGINIKEAFPQMGELKDQLCTRAIQDATESADEVFKQLDLQRGKILNVNVNDRSSVEISSWEIGYQNAYGQYTFSMTPKNVTCSVNMTFEIQQPESKE